MPYINPGVAASRGIEEFVTQRETLARQKKIDDLRTQQAELEILQKQTDMKNAATDRLKADALQEDANLMPGDVIDAVSVEKRKRLGIPVASMVQPGATIPAAPTGEVALPANDGANMDVPPGRDDLIPSNLVTLPGSPAVQMPDRNIYLGNPAQRMAAQALARTTDMRAKVAKAIADGMTPDEVMQGVLSSGGDPKEAKEIIDALKPKTQAVYRSDSSRRKIESLVNGQWVPLTGEPDKDAHWLTEPSVTNIGMNGPAPTIDDAWIRNEGAAYARTRVMPSYAGASGTAIKSAIDKASVLFDVKTNSWKDGWTGDAAPNLVRNGASYVADKDSLIALQKNFDAATSFANTAHANHALLTETLGKVPDVGVQGINGVARWLSTQFGSDAMVQFNGAIKSLNDEYSRIISQPSLTGVLTDSARTSMEKVLDSRSTASQIVTALKTLDREAANRVTNYNGQIQVVKSRMGPDQMGGSNTPPPSTETPQERAARLRAKYSSPQP